MLLVPFQGGLRAIDPDVQVVLVPAADLRGVEHPLCSALEPQEDVAVVVEPAAAHKRAQVRAELLDPESGDVAGEVLGVGPDVPHAARRSALPWVGPPDGLLEAGALDGL